MSIDASEAGKLERLKLRDRSWSTCLGVRVSVSQLQRCAFWFRMEDALI